jgi:hypothetical protein
LHTEAAASQTQFEDFPDSSMMSPCWTQLCRAASNLPNSEPSIG